MKKTKKGMFYDTEVDMEVAKYERNEGEEYISEALYLTANKRFYIYWRGWAKTIYWKYQKKGEVLGENIEVLDWDGDISLWADMKYEFLSKKDINNIHVIRNCIYT